MEIDPGIGEECRVKERGKIYKGTVVTFGKD